MEKIEKKWSLITGASRGIGRCLAVELAKKNINIIAIARSQNELNTLKVEIEELGCECLLIKQDLSEGDAPKNVFQAIPSETLRYLHAVCLNAALSALGPFSQTPAEVIEKIVAVNINFNAKFSRLILPYLENNKSSYIFFFSSQGAIIPTPWMATYAATKSFIHYFSLALSYEYKDSNVKIVTVVPAPTQSSVLEKLQVTERIKNKFPQGSPAPEIVKKITDALEAPSSRIATNVEAFYLFKVFISILPTALLLKMSAKMMSAFSKEAFYEKPP